jgi:hypothetical protein
VTSSLTPSANAASVAPVPGTPIDLAGVNWSGHASTLVVAISSACPHCVNETPFYREITLSPHQTPVYIVIPDQKQAAQSFLEEHHVTPSRTFLLTSEA